MHQEITQINLRVWGAVNIQVFRKVQEQWGAHQRTKIWIKNLVALVVALLDENECLFKVILRLMNLSVFIILY
jgi:hypothetical protein